MSKTKARLRKKVWWPGLSADTENYIKSCYACQVTTPSTVQCERLKIDIPTFQEKQKKNYHKTLTRLDGHKKKSKQYTDNKRNAKLINISRNYIFLAKDIHPKKKLSNLYELNPYIVTKVYKRSAKIKNDKGEYVRAKAHLKVLQGDKSKVNIQGSEKAVVTQANFRSKQPYPPHTISHTMYT